MSGSSIFTDQMEKSAKSGRPRLVKLQRIEKSHDVPHPSRLRCICKDEHPSGSSETHDVHRRTNETQKIIVAVDNSQLLALFPLPWWEGQGEGDTELFTATNNSFSFKFVVVLKKNV